MSPTIEWKAARYSIDYGSIRLPGGEVLVATVVYMSPDRYALQLDLPGDKARVTCNSQEDAKATAQERVDRFTNFWKAAK